MSLLRWHDIPQPRLLMPQTWCANESSKREAQQIHVHCRYIHVSAEEVVVERERNECCGWYLPRLLLISMLGPIREKLNTNGEQFVYQHIRENDSLACNVYCNNPLGPMIPIPMPNDMCHWPQTGTAWPLQQLQMGPIDRFKRTHSQQRFQWFVCAALRKAFSQTNDTHKWVRLHGKKKLWPQKYMFKK